MRRPANQALQPAPADGGGRLTAAVPVPVLVAASAGHLTWLSWAAVPAGVATGVVLASYLGRRATRRLESGQAGVLKVLADAAR